MKGEWLDWVILWVFSNLSDSMILSISGFFQEFGFFFFFPFWGEEKGQRAALGELGDSIKP